MLAGHASSVQDQYMDGPICESNSVIMYDVEYLIYRRKKDPPEAARRQGARYIKGAWGVGGIMPKDSHNPCVITMMLNAFSATDML